MKPIARWSIVAVTTILACSSAAPPPDPTRPDDVPVTTGAAPAPAVPQPPPTPAPPASDPCASSTEIKLELLAEQSAPSAVVRIGLHNLGTVPACVLTHIATHEWQHDWLEIQLVQGGKTRSLVFNDNRDKSAAHLAVLAPGQTDWQEVDVVAWARRTRNGSAPIPKGEYAARVTYDSSREHGAWAGTLETSVRLRVR